MNDIEILDVPTLTVIGMRKTGKYAEMASMFPRIFEYAIGNGAQIAGAPMAIMHESSEEEAMKADEEGSADLEIVVPIASPINGTDEITCYDLPGGRMAKIIHKGPYESTGDAYNELFGWLKENNYTLSGYLREAYLNDPREVTPEETLTEIYAPIE